VSICVHLWFQEGGVRKKDRCAARGGMVA